MIRLRPPTPTIDQLRAQAASGSSGVAKRAQDRVQALMTEQLKKDLGRS